MKLHHHQHMICAERENCEFQGAVYTRDEFGLELGAPFG